MKVKSLFSQDIEVIRFALCYRNSTDYPNLILHGSTVGSFFTLTFHCNEEERKKLLSALGCVSNSPSELVRKHVTVLLTERKLISENVLAIKRRTDNVEDQNYFIMNSNFGLSEGSIVPLEVIRRFLSEPNS